ncbi:hypothetical protein NL676_013910 [Syzygium grande]|nr:hypothetical protein NL676_013910 [Syzygium grande]
MGASHSRNYQTFYHPPDEEFNYEFDEKANEVDEESNVEADEMEKERAKLENEQKRARGQENGASHLPEGPPIARSSIAEAATFIQQKKRTATMRVER